MDRKSDVVSNECCLISVSRSLSILHVSWTLLNAWCMSGTREVWSNNRMVWYIVLESGLCTPRVKILT